MMTGCMDLLRGLDKSKYLILFLSEGSLSLK